MRITLKTKILSSIGVVWLLSFPVIGKSENWPQFRGWNATGISEEKGLPVRWSNSENVRWRRELPGPGHSSPTIWGDRIFLTAYQPEEGLARLTSFLTGRPAGQLWVLALSAETGNILWQHEVPVEEVETGHKTNSPASPSPVTDGENVYFYFGSYGLLCYDLEGNKIWELPLGPYANEWGTASSPILYGDTVIQNVDNDEESYLLAVDKRTGKQRWRASRAGFLRGYATPMLWEINGRTELVVSGSFQVKSYDPDTGREIWNCRGLTRWVNPTPVAGHGLLFVTSNGSGRQRLPGHSSRRTGRHYGYSHSMAVRTRRSLRSLTDLSRGLSLRGPQRRCGHLPGSQDRESGLAGAPAGRRQILRQHRVGRREALYDERGRNCLRA